MSSLSKTKTSVTPFWLLLTLVLISASKILSQSGAGGITGIVKDPSEATIPNANIVARNVDTGVEITTTTTETGGYSFIRLPVGNYTVKASAQGFQSAERTDIRVVLGVTLTVDMELPLGSLTETATVVAQATAVDTTSSTAGGTRVLEEIRDLPLQVTSSGGGGRDPLNFIRTMPGVVFNGPNSNIQGVGDGGSFRSISGARVDGIVTAVQQNQALNVSHAPIPELIEEFRVVTNQNAENGWDLGTTVELVTKSGNNQFHGGVYEYLRNDVLDARNWFASTVSPQQQNEFGGFLGGPIVKHKHFFMANYSGYRFRTTSADQLATVPTTRMRNGDFSELLGAQIGTDALGRPVLSGQIFDPLTTRADGKGGFLRDPFPGNVIPSGRLSSISKHFQDSYPLPSSSALLNNWRGLGLARKVDSDRYYIKTDSNFGAHRISFTFEHKPRIEDISGTCIFAPDISQCTEQSLPQRRVRLNYAWTLANNLVFAVRAGLNQDLGGAFRLPESEDNGARAGLKGVFTPNTPGVSIQNYTGFGGQTLNRRTNTAIPIGTDLNWVKGKHSYKFGAEVLAGNTPQTIESVSSGAFNFVQRETGIPGFLTTTGSGYASYLLGEVDSAQVQSPRSLRYNNYAWGFYAQDQWRLTSRLTVNYGLRYDLYLPFGETYDRFGAFDPTVPNPAAEGRLGGVTYWGDGPGRNGRKRILDAYTKGFGPRLGLAYQLDTKTVVRAYYGIQRYPLNNLANNGINFPGVNLGWGVLLSKASLDNGVTSAFNWNDGFPLVVPPLPNTSPSLVNGSSVAFIDPQESKSGAGQSLGFSIERDGLPGGLTAKAEYVGKLLHNLPNNTLVSLNQLDPKYLPLGNLLLVNINSPQAQAAGIPVPYSGFNGSVAQALRPFPQFDQIPALFSMSGTNLYHSLQTTIQKRFSQGLTFLVSYTFSKSVSNDQTANFAGLGAPTAVQHNDQRSVAKSLGPLDRPQVLNVSYLYELPFGPNQKFLNSSNSVLKQIVGGWQIAAIHNYQSGAPVAIATQAAIPTVGAVWANRVLDAPILTGQGCGDYDPNASGRNQVLNINAFSTPAPFTFGNTRLLPNVRSCASSTDDFSILKKFPIREGVQVHLGADLFNAFNRHSWGGLNTNIGQAATFGRYFSASSPRSVQFHLKVRF